MSYLVFMDGFYPHIISAISLAFNGGLSTCPVPLNQQLAMRNWPLPGSVEAQRTICCGATV